MLAQANLIERGQRALATAAPGGPAVDLGEHHVLHHAAMREQVEGLEDEADATAAQAGARAVAHSGDVCALEEVAALGLHVEAADDVEQRRLAGARGPDDRKPLASLDAEVHVDQRQHRRVAAEAAADTAVLWVDIRDHYSRASDPGVCEWPTPPAVPNPCGIERGIAHAVGDQVLVPTRMIGRP